VVFLFSHLRRRRSMRALTLVSTVAVVLAVCLGACAAPDYLDTCPEFQTGCTNINECTSCHPSCVFCQNIGSDTCDYEDCMTCLPGLHHIQAKQIDCFEHDLYLVPSCRSDSAGW
jgi:hypothetical protein